MHALRLGATSTEQGRMIVIHNFILLTEPKPSHIID
jgi:hypothetical protein